ncbi:hypothetical protein [Hymenobacter siberiensis]|jgi:hypothetical protein|uniref:hypothetical protein n=1 Tax=Hymenobacter siberiensis TaxID=2848396 RepID=UPI001C1DEBDA|nr:hypothetical protein [Hymenobacter siberiensis]
MSDKPSGTLGGLISGLFGGRTNDDGTRAGASSSSKVVGGALLAAGAAYLYKRYKSGNLNVPGITPK